MRFVVDGLVALMILAMLAGVFLLTTHDRSDSKLRETIRREVRRFQQEITLQAALGTFSATDPSYPDTIDPDWFDGDPPENPLLGPSHPWVEVAPVAERHLRHPPDLATSDPGVARFWYNPRLGVIRGRVPREVSDSATLEVYNFINDSHVATLHGDEPD